MTRRGLLIVGLFALTASLQSAVHAQEHATAQTTLDVEGMHCGACAERIEDVLGRLRGVVSADVDYDQTRAVVVYQPNRITPARIIAAIEDAGFSASVRRQ